MVVAEAATGPEALAMARAHRPDVAVLDLQMPGADGVRVATSLRAELPGCRTHDRDQSRAARASQAGAGGGCARVRPEDRQRAAARRDHPYRARRKPLRGPGVGRRRDLAPGTRR